MQEPISQELLQDLERIFEIFDGMRTKMRNSQRYSGKDATINKFNQALNVFTHEIDPDFVPPFMPVKREEDDWLAK
jgi:hypothetical protein